MKKAINEEQFRKVVQDLLKEMVSTGVLKEEKGNIYLGTDKNKVPSGKDQKKVNMAEKDSEIGYDKKPKLQTQVSAAGASHNGPSTKGMKKAEFETKDGLNDKNLNGGKEKGDLHFDVEMDQNDKDIDDAGVKTYVTAGAEMKGGQKASKSSEKAPEVKDKEPIAKGIQLPEGFENKKYTQKELKEFIYSEAKKLIK